MPSLVSELTPSQRTWLVENFGGVDAGDYNLQTTESESDSQHHFPEQVSERRVSDAATLTLSHSRERASVQFTPPQTAHAYYTLPHAPDLQHHQPSPTGVSEHGRSAIFRRPGMMPDSAQQQQPQEPHLSDLTPRPWTPDRTSAGDQYPYSYYHHQQQQHLHHHPHHPTPQQHHYDASRNFAILRPSSFRNAAGGMLLDKFQNTNKRPNPSSTSAQQQTPKYPHEGDKLTWQQSYENLQIYKETYGDCDVPQKYKHNFKLGGWVNKQRKKKKNPSKYGKLSETQIAMMETLGFKWNVEQSS